MSARTRPPRPKELPLDTIPDEVLRAHVPTRPTTGEHAPDPPETSPDLGDGSVPGTPARLLLEAQAERLENMSSAFFLCSMMDGIFDGAFDKYTYRVYLDNLLAKMAPADPIERLLSEQLILAHHAIGRLHVKAANAQQPDVGQLYSAAAARLLGEFRLTALALKTYRGAPAPAGKTAPETAGAAEDRNGTARPAKPGAGGRDEASGTPAWVNELASKRLNGVLGHELAGNS
jgi:hypothetical protein